MKILIDILMTLLVSLMGIVFVFVLVTVLSRTVNADNFFEVDNLSITYKNYTNSGSEPLVTNNGLPSRGLDKNLSMNLDTSIFGYMYLNTMIHSDTDYNTLTGERGQFRTIGLQYELGLRVVRQLDLFVYHHSQHDLDNILPYAFPVQDAIGIRINLIKSKRYDTLFE